MRTTYRQEVKKFQDQIKRDLIMLRHDPHFVSLMEMFDQSRLRFFRAAATEGVTQKDQDKLLGAAKVVDEMYNFLTQNEKTNDDAGDTGG